MDFARLYIDYVGIIQTETENALYIGIETGTGPGRGDRQSLPGASAPTEWTVGREWMRSISLRISPAKSELPAVGAIFHWRLVR